MAEPVDDDIEIDWWAFVIDPVMLRWRRIELDEAVAPPRWFDITVEFVAPDPHT